MTLVGFLLYLYQAVWQSFSPFTWAAMFNYAPCYQQKDDVGDNRA